MVSGKMFLQSNQISFFDLVFARIYSAMLTELFLPFVAIPFMYLLIFRNQE